MSSRKWIRNETKADQVFSLKCETEISKRAPTLKQKNVLPFIQIFKYSILVCLHRGEAVRATVCPPMSRTMLCSSQLPTWLTLMHSRNLKIICWRATCTGQRGSPLACPASALCTPPRLHATGSQSAIQRLAPSAMPGNLFQVQTLEIHPGPTKLESLGMRACNLFCQVLQVI